MTGVIKKKTDKGFGFITIDGQNTDVFFHHKALVGVTFAETGKRPDADVIATPGNSNHGRGEAVDAFLVDKDGKLLTLFGASNKLQCKSDPKYVKQLAEIFYAADSANFKRLETEIWHFEYGIPGIDSKHDQFKELPKTGRYKCL
jgi:cold shock CspA family protein